MVTDHTVVLKRIENQRKLLGMSRADLSFQAGIKYQTYTAYFKRGTLPRFNDLYSLCNALGIPIDDLFRDDEVKAEDNPLNIYYWVKFICNSYLDKSTLLYRVSDKTGIALLLNDLYTTTDIRMIHRQEVFGLFSKLLTLDEMDFILIYKDVIRKELAKYDLTKPFFEYYNDEYRPLFAIYSDEYMPLFLRGSSCFEPLPISTYLWQEFDSVLRQRNINKSTFYSQIQVTPAIHSKYFVKMNTEKIKELFNIQLSTPLEHTAILDKISELKKKDCIQLEKLKKMPSPTSETVIRLCEYLNIDNMETIIRTGMQESLNIKERAYPCTLLDDDRGSADPRYVFLYSVYSKVILDSIYSMPRLAAFFCALCAFTYDIETETDKVTINEGAGYSEEDFKRILAAVASQVPAFHTYRYNPVIVEDSEVVANEYQYKANFEEEK